jgi:hypothetical protein
MKKELLIHYAPTLSWVDPVFSLEESNGKEACAVSIYNGVMYPPVQPIWNDNRGNRNRVIIPADSESSDEESG